MKNTTYKYLKYYVLILGVGALFLINPFFENKYFGAEKNVRDFKKLHKPEYDSLVKKYDIQSELIHFKNDSAENVINQEFLLLKHEIEMQKLTELISENEYERKFKDIVDLEFSEISTIGDSFVQKLIRLDYPEEMKVPRYLSKEVTLYQGIDGLIGIMKWLILVFSIVVIIIEYFKNGKSENNYVNAGLQDYDQRKQAVELLKQNVVVLNGIELVLTGYETPDGYEAIDPIEGSVVSIPVVVVDKIRGTGNDVGTGKLSEYDQSEDIKKAQKEIRSRTITYKGKKYYVSPDEYEYGFNDKGELKSPKVKELKLHPLEELPDGTLFEPEESEPIYIDQSIIDPLMPE